VRLEMAMGASLKSPVSGPFFFSRSLKKELARFTGFSPLVIPEISGFDLWADGTGFSHERSRSLFASTVELTLPEIVGFEVPFSGFLR